MDQPATTNSAVLISGRNPQWTVGLCLLLGGLSLSMGGFLVLNARRLVPPAVVLLLAGGALVSTALILSFALATRRRYLIPTPHGFVYTTITGERSFVDDDVMCVSLTSRDNYFGGNRSSITRRFIMWIETGGIPESIDCVSHLRPGQSDPLSDLIVRVIRGLHDAARKAYAEGDRVEGDGWFLDRGQLILKSRQSHSVTNISDLAAADVVGNQIHIWRHGDERPFGRIPTRTANAHLLLLMLEELMPRPNTEAELAPGSLGRLLFERGPGGHALFAIGWLISLLLGLGSILIFARGARIRFGRRRVRARVFSIFAGATSLFVAVILVLRQRGRFRRYVYGIQQLGMFGTRQLRFTEIGNMSYASHRAYVHGVYTGTTLTLSFAPIPSTGLKPIRFSTTVTNSDSELDKLRDDLSVVIARRMHDFWSQYGHCPWMPYLRFAKEGLEHQPLTLTGRKPATLIPYTSIVNFTIDENLFRVWVNDQKTSLVNEDIGQPNFYPGLVFLSELVQSLHEPQTSLYAPAEQD